MDRTEQKLLTFVEFAGKLAKLSTCKRKTNGAVVFPPDFSRVLAIGYNGPSVGKNNDACRGPEAVGSCGCAHAEANAVVKLTERGIMYCTTSPCEACASLIVNSRRIVTVVYAQPYRDADEGIHTLAGGNVETVSLETFRRGLTDYLSFARKVLR
jgi:deoxycytidylate deaminase